MTVFLGSSDDSMQMRYISAFQVSGVQLIFQGRDLQRKLHSRDAIFVILYRLEGVFATLVELTIAPSL
ncbi:hypothetical protein A0H81_10951 [Grifola frondosa]|uniref:Uncharacterized protein n=1 Tax=Grifola frondosa TaxID=5627 RepID=A0A1C7M297_GRIFR|nr:hypothetical protein A0H81_10951 [Grifola frondosa]